MRSLLAVLVIAALVAPVYGQAFFKVTGDGSFDTYRSPSNGIEGYANAGAQTAVRMAKYNQHNGWISFKDAVADGSGQSLSAFLAANPSAQAFIYLRMTAPLTTETAYAVSIRTGNQGNLVEDLNTNGVGTQAAPAAGYTGASELQAWRGAAPFPGTSFLKFGSGIYTLDDPNRTDGTQGQPWITPSTRLPNSGSTPFKWNPNQAVRYDTGVMLTTDGLTPATGKYLGFFPDPDSGAAGRSYWALEDVLGMNNNNSRSASTASITNAGQIMIGGNAAPLKLNASLVQNAADPRNNVVDNWMAIPVDAAFLADMANNAENKGIYFGNNFAGLTATYSNWGYYTKEQNDASTPYLYVTPEPATMILLALGGLVALRRRAA